ncbi:tetratricopeptide repeat protein [bacterium]|nr:tetratricopeptide repeat protein [bacterium]
MKNTKRQSLLKLFQTRIPKNKKLAEALFSMIPQGILEKMVLHPDELERVGERRVVTALFADISGFTTLSETLEAEEVLKIVNTLFTRLLGIISQYEGVVDKFMGDAMMVLFGAPKAHEDDPRRAVEAALDMQKAVSDFRVKPKGSDKPFRIRLSIGINTGYVVSGLVGSDLHREYTILGDAVNVAARLEGLANAGEIIIGEETYKQVQSYYSVQAKEPIKLKGKTAFQRCYLIEDKKSTINVRIHSEQKPLFGKKRIFDRLKKCLQGHTSERMLVIGETGFGKTLLINHLLDEAEKDDYLAWAVNALPWGENLRYGLFSDLLKKILSIGAKKIGLKALRKLVRDLAPQSLVYLPLLGDLVSIAVPSNEIVDYMDAEQKAKALEELVANLLSGFAEQKLTMLVLEDISYIDSGSLNIINLLCRDFPGILVLTARPEILDKWQPPAHLKIRQIPPLSREKIIIMLRHLIGIKRIPRKLVNFIVEQTSGNPYYAEQLTNYLLRNNKVSYVGNRILLGDIDDRTLPSGIFNLLVTHIDGIEPGQQELIQLISVIGANAPYQVLIELCPPETLDNYLPALLQNGILLENRIGSETRYSFQSPLYGQAAYSLLLSDTQVKLHKKVANTFEKSYHSDLYDYYEVLSYHYQKANIPRKAFDYLYLAANKQVKLYANKEALYFYKKAEEIGQKLLGTEEVDRLYFEILASQGRLFWLSGDTNKAIEKNRQASEIAKKLDDIALLSDTLNNIALLYNVKGDYEKSMEIHMNALAIRKKLKDNDKIMQSLMNIGILQSDQGKFDEAIMNYNKALKMNKNSADLNPLCASIYSNLGFAYHNKCELKKSLDYYQKALEIDRSLGILQGLGINYINIANVYDEWCQFDKMTEFLEKALKIFQRVGDVRANTLTLNNLGDLLRKQDKVIAAIKLHRKALRLACEQNDITNQIDANRNIGLDYMVLKKLDLAAKYMKKSVQLAEENIDLEGQLEGYYALLGYYKMTADEVLFNRTKKTIERLAKKHNPLFLKKIQEFE